MPGETLYLPVGWWHYVRQSIVTVALNWWYDAELRGMSWIMLNFLRNPVEILTINDDDEEQRWVFIYLLGSLTDEASLRLTISDVEGLVVLKRLGDTQFDEENYTITVFEKQQL